MSKATEGVERLLFRCGSAVTFVVSERAKDDLDLRVGAAPSTRPLEGADE
jgi:hypothetical protein